MDNDYDVRDDVYFMGYFGGNTANDISREKYAKEIAKLCKAIAMEFGELVEKCKVQQRTRIVPNEDNPNESILIEFDANSPNSLAKIAQDKFVDFCKSKGNSNVTINNAVIVIRTFLKSYGINLPRWTPLKEEYDDWTPLTKEDFIFVMKDSSLPHQALITFMLSTGIRIGDCLNFTIRDFMEATEDYHDFKDVKEFIDNAPDDMLGYWNFQPKKTKRYGIWCATVNSAESSNYILQNLRRIKNQYLPRKSKRIKKELTISKDDALFGSHHKKYKQSMTVKSITDQFTIKNHKLHEWRVSQIKNDIAQGKYSEEDFEILEKEIPRFHAHGCRKFFINTLDKKCSDSRLRRLMEGHKPPSKIDKSYVKKLKKEVLNVYKGGLWECLTLEGIEVKTITTKEAKELHDKINSLEEELAEARNSIPSVNNQYEKNIWNVLFNHYSSKNMFYGEKIAESEVLCQYALEFAIKDIINFNKDDEEYLDKLFEKARAVNELYPNDFEEVRKRAVSHYRTDNQYSSEVKLIVQKILVASSNYGFVESIVRNNYQLAEQNVAKYVEDNEVSLDDLEDSDLVKKILFEVVVDI